MTKVSSIAIELKTSRGTFSSIGIELKSDGQRALSFSYFCMKTVPMLLILMKMKKTVIFNFLSTVTLKEWVLFVSATHLHSFVITI